MNWRVRSSTISGTISVPGDKSIAHRSLMLAALTKGESRIDNLPAGEDVLSTVRCLRDLGVALELDGAKASVRSTGALREPVDVLDAGNSGTTMRLLSGILAAQPFASSVTGDASLQRRPMGRIVEPLQRMGASISSREGRPPLHIRGAGLHGIRYDMPVASAQVKSCILFAALPARGETLVTEPYPTRDHTERLFAATGITLDSDERSISIAGGQSPAPFASILPGDLSTAAFFFAAAALSGGCVTVRDCGVNPTRVGFLTVLQRMGIGVEHVGMREEVGEPVADVTVAAEPIAAFDIDPPEVPFLVDELPLLALMATQASGTSTVRGAEELRVKECDRIHAVAESLASMGADVQERRDGFVIRGPTPLRGATVSSYGDHRIAMMLTVAGTIARGESVILDTQAAAVSFPQFGDVYAGIGALIDAA